MITGLVVASVGAQLAIDDPLGHPRATATITILGGTALFLAGRILVEYLVFKRLPANRFIALGALACLSPLMLLAPPLINGIAVGTVLAAIVIGDNILRRRQPAPISPPGPHRPETSETISLDPAVWAKFADAAGNRDVAALLSDLVKWFVQQPGATLPPRT
jgi:hypothetical protein